MNENVGRTRRKKVTLAFIASDSERKASYKKRKKGLIKKVRELSTLCGVDACAIIYSQYDAVPEVWPSVLGAQEVLARFRKLSEIEQGRKMMNQESYTRQRIKKAEEQLHRLRKENNRRHMENFMFQCFAGRATLEQFDHRDASDMAWAIKQLLRDISYRMETMGTDAGGEAPPPPVDFAPPPAPAPEGEDDLEGFPWGLAQSPIGFGGECEGGDLDWDDGMMMPFPFFFDNAEASTSAANEHGNGGN